MVKCNECRWKAPKGKRLRHDNCRGMPEDAPCDAFAAILPPSPEKPKRK